MKRFLAILVIAFSYRSKASLLGDTKSAAEKMADTEIIIDAVNELVQETTDDDELNNHLKTLRQKNADIRSTLMDLNYTNEEIEDLIHGDEISAANLASTIARTTRRIQRARQLKSKLSLLTSGSPAAVNAVQSIQMNQTLREIHSELAHQRMDRQIEIDNRRAAILEEKVAEKQKEAFFKKQFSLMQKSSRINNVSFFPFQEKTETKSKGISFFKWTF